MTDVGLKVTSAVRWTHDAVLETGRDLDAAELLLERGATAPSIGFHLWHMARWADRLAAHLRAELSDSSEDGQEIWESAGWVGRFGFASSDLGFGDTGMSMSEAVWKDLPTLDPAMLLSYVEAAFAEANGLLKSAASHAEHRCLDLYGRPGTVGDILVAHLSHMSRHLGMIEALVGLGGRPGSVTV